MTDESQLRALSGLGTQTLRPEFTEARALREELSVARACACDACNSLLIHSKPEFAEARSLACEHTSAPVDTPGPLPYVPWIFRAHCRTCRVS